MNQKQRGVILYGHGVDAVARALQDLDPRYVLFDRFAPEPGQMPVMRCPNGSAADTARSGVPDVAWLVVELHWPRVEAEHACDPILSLNTSKVDSGTAARVIDQPDLVTWYEVVNPVSVVAVDDAPAAADYSNIAIVVPDEHKIVAHAIKTGGSPPACLPAGAKQVLRSDILRALARSRGEVPRAPWLGNRPRVGGSPASTRALRCRKRPVSTVRSQ